MRVLENNIVECCLFINKISMCTVLVAPPMGFAVLLCFLVTVLTPSHSALVSKEVAFECGPHGKFEYCIDEFPGCVVGCHCHPGYYFDTDTKICEPNIKLTQQFRRQYQPEPTPTATAYPTFQSHPTYTTYPTYPTPTANENLHEKRQFLTKDTDELGDWLYNQFFQTIESQIIRNKTDLSNNEKAPTRRSGGAPGGIKTKRKARKHIRSRKKRKHGKERGLRKKLLRITEDDSLFDDNDSDSDSGSDSSSSSTSDSDSTSDDSSSDKDKSEGRKETKDTDHGDDHGHKKVIIFNRRPKPPLPSFIFLSSMDTPYYPPIGLPPPPLVPMYPMVPVPPMAPPMFPFPGPPKCDEESSKTTHTDDVTSSPATTTNTHQSSTTSSEPEKTTASTAANTDVTTETTSETTQSSGTVQPTDRRNSLRKHRRRPNIEKLFARASEPGKQRKLTRKQQTKLMQKLRDKLKGKRRNDSQSVPTQEKILEEFQDEDFNSDDLPNVSEDNAPSKQLHPQDNEEQHVPKLEDVDFKYLSELIHRVNQSKGRNRPPLPFNLNEDLKQLQKLQSSLSTRRDMGSYTPTRQVNRQGTDDVYYSNLGRRIASMIRNADSEVEIQFTKNSDHANHQNQLHSILNENSFLPRSFWERSIRSPALQRIPFEYLDESRTLRHSNEKRLINLENEFQVYASTPHPLSLQDLENILNTIKKAHAQLKQPTTSTKQSNVSMNVNLLPKYAGPTRRHTRLFDPSRKLQYITEHAQTPIPSIVYVEMHPAVVTNASVFHEPERKYNTPYSDYWIFNPEAAEHGTKPRPVFDQTSKPKKNDNQIYNKKPLRQPFVGVLDKHSENNRSRGEYLHFLKSRPFVKQTNPKKHPIKGGKYKNLNYFSGNKHYMFETDSYPLQQQQLLSPFNSQFSSAVRSEPSYFQNQYHQSEYFD